MACGWAQEAMQAPRRERKRRMGHVPTLDETPTAPFRTRIGSYPIGCADGLRRARLTSGNIENFPPCLLRLPSLSLPPVGRIVLLSFDVGLDIGGRHQAHRMTKHLKFTRAMMQRRTGLYTDQARWHLLKERRNISSLELTAKNHIAIRVDAVNLKN
jgi:hypothetical protein